MSGNKMTDVKNTEDLNVDSGFQSGGGVDYEEDGFQSGVGADFEEDSESGDLRSEVVVLDVPPKSDVKKVSSFEKVESGIVSDDICFMLDEMNLDHTTDDDVKVEHTILRPQATDLPLDLLFQQDDDGDTQLHIAAVQGYRKPVTTLIRICPNKELLNVCNDYGQTPLHLAVMGKDPVITRMLVLAGADIGIRDRRGDTPLHKATALANIECMQALLIPVQDQPRKSSSVLNQKNYNGQACVHLAATLGSMEALQTLLFYGADINSMENLGGWTALHIAAHRGDARLVSQLQRSAGLAARPLDFAGRSPRRLARAKPVAELFSRHEDSDDDSDEDEDMFDEEIENIFEIYSNQQIVA